MLQARIRQSYWIFRKSCHSTIAGLFLQGFKLQKGLWVQFCPDLDQDMSTTPGGRQSAELVKLLFQLPAYRPFKLIDDE